MSTTNTHTQAPASATSRGVREKHKEFLLPATILYYQEPLVLTEGKGLRIKDADGNEYLDFFGGILTVSVGHANERVNAAIKAQVRLESFGIAGIFMACPRSRMESSLLASPLPSRWGIEGGESCASSVRLWSR